MSNYVRKRYLKEKKNNFHEAAELTKINVVY